MDEGAGAAGARTEPASRDASLAASPLSSHQGPYGGLKHRTRDGGCVEDRRGTRDDGRKAKVIKISHKETEVRWRRSDDRGKT